MGSHFDENRQDEFRGVTTPPRGNGSEQCEVPNKTASYFNLKDSQLHQMRTDKQGTREHEVFRQRAEELLIDQKTEILIQKELQEEAARAEAAAAADRQVAALVTAAKAEADRQVTAAKAEAD